LRSITKEQISTLIGEHQLPSSYADDLVSFMLPISKQLSNKKKDQPLIVGVQGSQGSGKSTFAAFLKLLLEHEFNLQTEICSIDDFYLSRAERTALAESIHPLLQTRGVPGTHHTDLIEQQFALFKSKETLTLPQFNKATDNPKAKLEWLSTNTAADILIFEGWCVGLTPQKEHELTHAVNELEKNEDSDGNWRAFVNQTLSDEYKAIFKQLDTLIVLQAPSFDCVFEWRQLQEQKLINSLTAQSKSLDLTMNPKQIERFIQHYQRLTEHGLRTLKDHADFVLQLNTDHRITSLVDNTVKGAL